VIVAIHQPNYLPWLGYFHKMKMADAFIILDHVQLPGKGLPNRNYIKGKDGKKVLLTVPLKKTKGINSTYIDSIPDYSKHWQKEHLNKIKDAYLKAPYFEENYAQIEYIIKIKYESLSELCTAFIQMICHLLEIKTKIVLASSLVENELQKNDRNIDLCLQMGAKTYLSGQGAKKYNDENLFAQHQLNIIYQNFEAPIYPQLGEEFIANLSIIDILFNVPVNEIKKIIDTKLFY
jgi:hypothetical protein